MCAASLGSDVVLGWLLDNVNYMNDVINMEGCYGFTALHFAAVLGRNQCYDMLVQHGADETCVDKHGKTPLQ